MCSFRSSRCGRLLSRRLRPSPKTQSGARGERQVCACVSCSPSPFSAWGATFTSRTRGSAVMGASSAFLNQHHVPSWLATYLQVWIRPAFPAFVTTAVVINNIDFYVYKVLYTVIPIISSRLVFVYFGAPLQMGERDLNWFSAVSGWEGVCFAARHLCTKPVYMFM